MPVILVWKDATALPVEAECLRPDSLAGLSASEISALRLSVGNTSAEVGDLFGVEVQKGRGDDRPGPDYLLLEGHMPNVSRIGEGMASGKLRVLGDVGPYFALGMSGGDAYANGSAGPYAGAEMRGGDLLIVGDAGDHLGSALPGSVLGMRGGEIRVGGSAGSDVGQAMRRGLISVDGAVGTGAGRGMVAGSIFIGGPAGTGLGSGLKRGSLVLLGGSEESILPTFASSGSDHPPFLSIYLRHVKRWGWPVPDAALSSLWDRFNGDLACGGQGEIWLWRGPVN